MSVVLLPSCGFQATEAVCGPGGSLQGLLLPRLLGPLLEPDASELPGTGSPPDQKNNKENSGNVKSFTLVSCSAFVNFSEVFYRVFFLGVEVSLSKLMTFLLTRALKVCFLLGRFSDLPQSSEDSVIASSRPTCWDQEADAFGSWFCLLCVISYSLCLLLTH